MKTLSDAVFMKKELRRTPRPHVATRQFHARVGVVGHMIIVPELHEASLRPRVLLARVGLGGLLLCTVALFQLIPFFFERRIILYHAQSFIYPT